MRLLVSDANIVIDMDEGGLLPGMFALGQDIGTPDLLFEQELAEHHPELPRLGLRLIEAQPDMLEYAAQLATQRPTISFTDALAAALAGHTSTVLLTGDAALRAVAEAHGIAVHGTVWLVDQLVTNRIVPAADARLAYRRMRDARRRLPWPQIARQVRSWGLDWS